MQQTVSKRIVHRSHFILCERFTHPDSMTCRGGMLIDVYHPEENEVVRFDNSDKVIGGLCSELEKKKRQIKVVMEGTGGYRPNVAEGVVFLDEETADGDPVYLTE